MYIERKNLYRQLEESRDSKVLTFVTGDRRGMETKIARDAYDFFVNHLDIIGVVPKISLFIYTPGGDTLAAWGLVNLIKQFCDQLEVIVPSKALSAGTLMCLGAKNIVMTKQATLGPIDPSVNAPLNPQIPGGAPNAKAPVSVEAINGFLDLAKNELGIKSEDTLSTILVTLCGKIHPLVLGEVYRAKSQIQMLARKLVVDQVEDPDKIEKIISFLCSESGSHDYTIHRREARESLGLNIEKPSQNLYDIIKSIYDDIEKELELNSPFDPRNVLGLENNANYKLKRALVETIDGGSHQFLSEGNFVRGQIQMQPGSIPQISIQDNRLFEGWRHETE